jgi:hypothetical protein
MVYDTSDNSPIEVDPKPGLLNRTDAAIGSNTVAFIQYPNFKFKEYGGLTDERCHRAGARLAACSPTLLFSKLALGTNVASHVADGGFFRLP